MELVDEGFESSALSDQEKTVIRFTDAILAAEPVGPEVEAALLACFDEGQVAELGMGVALFLGFSKIAIALGQAPDDMPTMVVPTPDWSA